jgi:hypothetical protein
MKENKQKRCPLEEEEEEEGGRWRMGRCRRGEEEFTGP